ncbi:polyprenol phosphomannose-dependent alpha 1,6 mannosyltransferase MptB [Haloechinothrix salitolerans]|uniref:Polyprenol phosphomannose-dependent alpha 1,6 mannosyltransferase MptB n=1 Tax=Haloechinothrix salitolerans TaxID=926830 RepID=A0ABW2BRR0_9PSEU
MFPEPSQTESLEQTGVSDNQSHTARRVPLAQVAGLVGVLLLAASSVSVGAVPVDADPGVIPALGGIADLPVLGLAAALVGMGLVVTGWLLLATVLIPHPGAISSRRIVATIALWIAPLLVVPPMFSDDVYSYLGQGAVANQGFDPYAGGPADFLARGDPLGRNVSGYWERSAAPYGPVFLLIAQLIVRIVGADIIAGIALHRIAELVGLALVLWALTALARRTGGRMSRALWLGVLNPLVLFHLVAGIHNDALMLGLMLAGTELALRGLDHERLGYLPLVVGVGLIGTAAAVKLPAAAALTVVVVVLTHRWGGGPIPFAKSVTVTIGLFGAVLVAFSMASGFGFGWVTGLSTPGEVNSWLAPTNQVGFLVGGIGMLAGVSITQAAIGVGKVIGAVVAVVLGILVLRRMLDRTVEPLTGLGLLFAVAVVCGPVVQPWYLLWCVLPLSAVALHTRWLWVLTWTSAVLAVIVPPLGSGIHGNVPGIALGYALAFAVLATVIMVARSLRIASPAV